MIKLSVNEAKWSSLLDRTRTLILYISIWIFDFGPEKLPGLSRNWPRPLLHSTFKFAMKKLIELITFWSECRYVANCARCPDKINCRRCKPRYFKIKISASHNSTCVVSCPRGFAKKGRRCQRITEGNQSFNSFCLQQWLKVLNNFNFYLALVYWTGCHGLETGPWWILKV